ncbi:hypothetical protein OAH34_02425 [bacterium]|nr:hypothetical protein [bacterium]
MKNGFVRLIIYFSPVTMTQLRYISYFNSAVSNERRQSTIRFARSPPSDAEAIFPKKTKQDEQQIEQHRWFNIRSSSSQTTLMESPTRSNSPYHQTFTFKTHLETGFQRVLAT